MHIYTFIIKADQSNAQWTAVDPLLQNESDESGNEPSLERCLRVRSAPVFDFFHAGTADGEWSETHFLRSTVRVDGLDEGVPLWECVWSLCGEFWSLKLAQVGSENT